MIVRTVMAFLAVGLLLSKPAVAVTGSVSKIVVQIATDAELEEAIGPRGTLVQRESDPKDLRILDGYTPGGVSIRNFAALTNPPPDYDRDVNMHAHHVRLDGSYSINAEAGRMSAWYGTNAFLQILAASSASGKAMLSVAAEGTNMVFTVAATNDNVVVETSASLESPVWTEAPFVLERLSPLTVKIKVAEPPVGEIRFVRVQTTSGDVGMVLSIPLSVPSLAVGGADVTAESIASWNAAFGWGDHAAAHYLTDETDPDFSISVAAGITTNLVASWNAAFGWGDHAAAGYLTDESDPEFAAWILGNPLANYVPVSIVNGDYYVDMCPDDSRNTILKVGADYEIVFAEDNVSYNGALWENINGVNKWRGPVDVPANSTNNFIRPYGGTNTISFDANGNMLISAGGNLAISVRTNGSVGIRGVGNDSYAFHLNGAGYIASLYTTKIFDGSQYVDPSTNGVSALLAGSIVVGNEQRIYFGAATNCWLTSNGTNLFFRNAAGTTNQVTSN